MNKTNLMLVFALALSHIFTTAKLLVLFFVKKSLSFAT